MRQDSVMFGELYRSGFITAPGVLTLSLFIKQQLCLRVNWSFLLGYTTTPTVALTPIDLLLLANRGDTRNVFQLSTLVPEEFT